MRCLIAATMLVLGACGGGAGGGSDTADSAADTQPDAPGDVASDVAADATPTCAELQATCEARAQLCEDGACVDPWRYGSPTFGTCEGEPRATAQSLAEKAAAFDDIAARLHVHPELGWAMTVDLPPGTDVDTATWADVSQWHTGENDGLWSGLYMASQAFRWAVTRDPEAEAILRVLMASELDRMRITGVPGLFTRQLIPPGVPGIACPTDDASYTTDKEKDDNRWVRISATGCAEVVARETGEWVTTEHCGLEAYAGWCFLDNVSQDEYGGHMPALAAVYKLVDIPNLRAQAATMLEEIAVHLMVNELAFVDWDGRITEHGKLWATSFANTPGFLATQALGALRLGADASGRADLEDFIDCLQQKDRVEPCLSWPLETGEPYSDHFAFQGILTTPDGCKSNYNTLSMAMVWFFDLLWVEPDPTIRAAAQAAMSTELFRADNPRALEHHQNAWFNIMWAATKPLGPGTDGPDFDAVEAAICSLKQFAPSKTVPTLDPGALYPHDCDGRLGTSQTAEPIPVAERCPRTFLWWGSPYARSACTEVATRVIQPADYLLAYWMGRYFDFIPADL